MSVSYDEVAGICESLIAQGVNPSTVAVRERLGRGSYSTIQKFRREWLQLKIKSEARLSSGFDKLFDEALEKLKMGFYEKCSEIASKEVAEQNRLMVQLLESETSSQLHQLQKLDEIHNFLQAAKIENQNLIVENRELKAENDELKAELEKSKAGYVRLQEMLLQTRQHYELALASKKRT